MLIRSGHLNVKIVDVMFNDGACAHRSMRLRTLAAVAALALAVGGCAASRSLVQSPEERAVDQHATTAGAVMTRGYVAVSARDAAWRVVGRRGDTTIQALVAQGTNRQGRIVLRITVDASNGSEFDAPVTRCYEYTIDWSNGQTGQPTPTNACSGPALILHPPRHVDLVSRAATARLLQLLAEIPAARRGNPALIRRKVASVFGPPTTVAVGPTNSGDLEVTVRADEQCAFALLPPNGKPTMIDTGHGTQCLS